MKRLFGIKNTEVQRTIPDMYFLNKNAAKKQRDALNKGVSRPIFTITYGPDHKKYKRA